MIDTIISRKACNSYIVYNEKMDAILVDPGYNFHNFLIDHINKIGVTIKAILITHGHYDHIDGLEEICSYFPKANVYINADEIDVLTTPKLNLSQFREDESNKILKFRPKHLIELYDGEEFEECGFKIRMIATPFHTKGSACYLIASEQMLFSGDTLFYTTIGRTDLPTGSSRTVESSLKKLIDLKEDYRVYPGHGVATKLSREKAYNTHLRNI